MEDKAAAQKKKDNVGFGGSFTDMGSKHATGMGHDYTAHPELRQEEQK
jgi:hypothetical protein